MELMDAIRQRRSIRMFDGRPVDRAVIEKLVDAATYAPSRWNVQPWHFHVATGDARKRVGEVMALSTGYVQEYLAVMGPEVIEFAARFFADLGNAPVVIAISSPHVDDATEYLDDTIAVGAALQSFLLAVVEEGLGACSLTSPHWIHDQLLEAFAVPAGHDITAMIVLGYSEEEPRSKERHTDVVTFLK